MTVELTESQKAQIEGQNLAIASWPPELADRQKLIRVYLEAKERETAEAKKAAEDAKKKVGADEHLKRMTKDYGYEKVAIDIIGKLKKITDPEKLGRVSRQVFETMKDEGMLVPDLFDAGVLGMTEGRAADSSDKPVFDNTPKGSQTKGLGGAAAKPGPTPAGVKPTAPVDLRVAAATLELTNFQAANPGALKGKKKAELTRLQDAVKEAEALAVSDPEGGKAPAVENPPSLDVAQNGAGLPEVNPDAPTDADLPELPAADGAQVSQEIAQGSAASDAHLAGQVAAATEVKVKPKRQSSKQKAAAEAAALQAQADASAQEYAASQEPAGPNGPDDEDEDPFAKAPSMVPPPIGGRAPASTRLG